MENKWRISEEDVKNECKINDDKWKTNVGKWMNGWREKERERTNWKQTENKCTYEAMHKWRISEQRMWGTKKQQMVNKRKINK